MSEQRSLADYCSNIDSTSETDRDLYKDEEWLHEQYIVQDKTLQEVADETSVTHTTVRRHIKKAGIETDSPGRTKDKLDPLRDESWLRQQYVEKGRSIPDIADELNTSFSVVGRYLDKNNIETRSPQEANSDGQIHKLENEEWLREQYIQQKKTHKEIANIINISPSTVGSYLEKHGIEKRDASDVQTDGDIELLKDSDWLRTEYVEKERPANDIAEEVEVSANAVLTWLDRHDIETRSLSKALSGVGRSHTEKLQDEDWLRTEYIGKGRSQLEISDELDVNRKTVRRWLDQHSIQRRSNSEARAEGDITPLQSKAYLYEQYIGQGRTLDDIADDLDVGVSTVGRWMRKHGIETRDRSERRAEGNVTPLHDKEWVNEEYVNKRRTLTGIASELGVARPTVRRHISDHGFELRSRNLKMDPDHLDHIVRSSWELRVAELLHRATVEYEYEGIIIDYIDKVGQTRKYTPDFITDKYIIEVKGIYVKEERVNKKARAAMETEDREYVVVGTEIPCDIHIPWDENEAVTELF